MRRLREIASALAWLGASAFSWPGQAERLVSALTEADTPNRKRDALRLLAELAQPFERAPVEGMLRDRDPEVRADALRLLAQSESEPGPRLAAALDDPAPIVRATAVEVLAEQAGADRREPLLRALGDAEPAVRSASARALATLQERAVALALAGALEDGAPEVRLEVAHALGQQSDPVAVTALLAHTEDPLPELRAAAVGELGRAPDPRVALALELALDDADEQVVLAALRSWLKAPEAAPRARLEALCAAPSPALAEAAQRVLSRGASVEPGTLPSAEAGALEVAVAPRFLAPLARTAEATLSAAEAATLVSELERVLPPGEVLAADPLLDWLRRAPSPLLPRVAHLIEQSRARILAERLPPWRADPDPLLRAAFARLVVQADGDASALLEPLLRDPSSVVRAEAARSLSRRLDRQGVELVLARLAHARGPARRSWLALLAHGLARTAAALSAAQRTALERALRPDLSGSDQVLASWAATALGWVDSERARAALLRAAADPRPAIQIAALRASSRDRSARARSLRRALLAPDADPRVVSTALQALALAGDPLPWPWLRAQLDRARWPLGPAAAFAIAEAALRGRAGEFERELCTRADSRDPIARANLIAALAALPELRCPPERVAAQLGSSAWLVRRAAERWAEVHESGDASGRLAADRAQARLRAEHAQCGACSESDGARLPAAPRALALADGRALISFPDGAGELAWPQIEPVAIVSAWPGSYANE